MTLFNIDSWVKYTQGQCISSFHYLQHFNLKETSCLHSLVVIEFQHFISAGLDKISKNSYSITPLLKKKEIMKLTCKWMKVEKKHSEWRDSDPGRQIWYVCTHMCTLAAKLMLTKIQQ